MTGDNLRERLERYEKFLDREIEDHDYSLSNLEFEKRDFFSDESYLDAYREAKDHLYRLFPELRK